MSANFKSGAPYLRTSRLFPDDNAQALSVEVDRSYLEIASAVNARTIGVFALNNQTVNGESWYFSGASKKEQGLRQVYTFTAAGSFAHNINLSTVTRFTKPFGSFTDGTNWYGAIYASNTAIAGQISFYITPTNIVVLAGAGAPTITTGIIVLEWLSRV